MLCNSLSVSALLLSLVWAAPTASKVSKTHTLQPDVIIQLEQGSGARGATKAPNIQNQHALFGVEASFTIPGQLLSPNATCSLQFQLNGLNSQGSWVGWAPDGSDHANITLLDGPVSTNDTWTSFPPVKSGYAGTLTLTETDGSHANVSFSPATIPCASTVGVRIVPAANTIILGWEQDISLPEGLVLVVQK